MESPWQILRDGGLPVAAPCSGTRRTSAELAAATRTAIAEEPCGRAAEALAAFVLAWRAHWPTSFAAVFVLDAPSVIGWAERNVADDGRYLKLRRIAVENLADVL
jgi:hypothetical protein